VDALALLVHRAAANSLEAAKQLPCTINSSFVPNAQAAVLVLVMHPSVSMVEVGGVPSL
jgi:hypothetical protein